MRKRIIATSLNKKRFLSGVFLTLLATVVNAQPFPYQQAGLPVSQRVDDLMKRMTLEEKIAQIRHLHSWDIFNEQTLDKEKLTAVVGETGYGFVEGFPLTVRIVGVVCGKYRNICLPVPGSVFRPLL